MQVNILGCRGVPAQHGGFETFAHRLSLFLVEKGHDVLVYCQPDDGEKAVWHEDEWQGVKRRHYVPKRGGAVGTMEFDLACVRDVLKRPGIDLVLGYNTAIFNVLERLKGRQMLMNMDGIEWHRAKWSVPAKIWFFINEVIGANICHLPIADHPEIARHIKKRSIHDPIMITYGSDVIDDIAPDAVLKMGLEPGKYFISIARLEPENSILEIVKAFSSVDTDMKLLVLGKLDPSIEFHRQVKAAASSNVIMPGAIYDQHVVQALRFHCRAYLHGHQVGGTNPSLVEALGAGNAVIAHDNRFNRWTAGDGQFFFQDTESCVTAINKAIRDDVSLEQARAAARAHHAAQFDWNDVLSQYEVLLERYYK